MITVIVCVQPILFIAISKILFISTNCTNLQLVGIIRYFVLQGGHRRSRAPGEKLGGRCQWPVVLSWYGQLSAYQKD